MDAKSFISYSRMNERMEVKTRNTEMGLKASGANDAGRWALCFYLPLLWGSRWAGYWWTRSIPEAKAMHIYRLEVGHTTHTEIMTFRCCGHSSMFEISLFFNFQRLVLDLPIFVGKKKLDTNLIFLIPFL